MRNLISAILLVLIFIFGSSCGHKGDVSQTAQIDQMLHRLDSVSDLLEEIDFEKEEELVAQANEEVARLKSMAGDSLPRKYVFLISNYSIIGGEPDEAEKNEKSNYEEEKERFIEKELAYCISQLKNLKHDFLGGKMDLKQFNDYKEVEIQKSEQMITYILKEHAVNKQKLALYTELHPEIVRLTDSLAGLPEKKRKP